MLRRSFLQGVAAGTLVSTSTFIKPSLALTQLGQSHFELVAEIGKRALGPVRTSQTDLWLYNGTTPGPMLTVTKGDELIVNFFNNLDQPTTIHWHGIRNLNEMDGVPDLTQVAVDPGEDFTYRFPVRDAGTFWYHAHSKAWEQVARGLYGPLIVREPDTNSGIEDITLVADDWRLTEEYQLHEESLGSMMDWSHQGRLGNWLTINGQSNPAIPIKAKNLARIRLINTANARSMTFEFEGKKFEVIALDGEPCSPFVAFEITIAPAQRVDILITTDLNGFRLSEISTGTPVIVATFKVQTSDVSVLNTSNRLNLQVKTFRSNLEMVDIDIHMQGGAMGNLASAFFEGEERPLQELAMEHSKLWAFDGSIGGSDHFLAEVDLGKTVNLRVWNDTSWPHAMHLHGHHFWVKSHEFGGEPKRVLRDTYLMQPNERAELQFVADNPGLWLFHCHMLEHHAAGMGGVIAIS